MSELKELVYKYALQNAVKHNGTAQNGAVIGIIMSSHPEFRKEAKEVSKTVAQELSKINVMSPEDQIKELDKLGGLVVEEKKVEEKGLSDLPLVKGDVVLRFAPNPSGPLHIGHARAAILNNEYLKKYGGKLILRIEDTDPRRVYPDAYQMIEEDLSWMGVKIDEKFIQSDRIPIYYEYAQKLIELGGAYMCTCEGGEFKKLKDQSMACPCRDMGVEESLKLWEEMENMDEGEAVLRVTTDIEHKNPAIRDFVAMRVVDAKHPRTGDKYKIYPMMNFSVAVDDHLMGMTHVLRGKDHLANSEKQKYIYEHFGWDAPVFIHYGRLKMDDIALSTSKAKEGIEEGTYSGWDDPRLGTIRAIAKRGIMKESLEELMNEIGVKIADSTVSWKKVYGLNRTILEEVANRYFFVWNPEKVKIDNLPESSEGIIERPLHPDNLERGNRELMFNNEVYLVKDDIKDNKPLRLMDAANIIFKDGNAVYHSSSFEEAKETGAQIIHWVPGNDNLNAEVVMPDASVVEGLVEPACRNLKVGDIVQLERFGFARLDGIDGEKLIFYFAHK
ncbi:glutamate--tRNA ligase [Methanobacterium sp. ACI-7]|uniref:glutamate--tRNA ligase n=1 Tax=unclassified Methanobacterium TaxID=2627676 RepID=UPI0039C13BAC